MNRLGQRSRLAVMTMAGVVVFSSGQAWAIKVVAYNLLNYPGTSATQRDPLFRTVLADLQPDIVIAGELQSASSAAAFRTNVLNVVNPGEWVEDVHYDCGDTDQALFYRSAVITTAGVGTDRSTTIGSTPRLSPRWKLRLQGYGQPSGMFYVYGCHLKASDTVPDADERKAGADLIRADANGFAAGTRFIVAGDMNFYRMSTEPGYTSFVGSQADNDGRLVDVLNPTNVLQEWHNNTTYRFMHTQSPRASNPSYSSDGTTGGMDDRFDFIFISTAMSGTTGLSYIASSYRSVGNDGNRCCNGSVNSPLPNGDVSDAVANALWGAADHLPVLLQLRAGARGTISTPTLAFGTVLVGYGATRSLTVNNAAPTPGETLTYQYASAPPGTFSGPVGTQASAAGVGNNDTISMNTSTAGVKNLSPALTITTNSSETPSFSVAATGTVLDHGVPSSDPGSQQLAGVVDFGLHGPGGFSNQEATIYNVGFNALQAPVEIYDAIFSGPDASRFSLVDVPSFFADASPAFIGIHFDDTGVTPGSTYSATVEFVTADDTSLPGAATLDSVTFALTAGVPFVKGDFNFNAVVDCSDLSPFVTVLLNPPGATALQRDIADMNSDTRNDGLDIQLFRDALICP